jgi:MurNAc alpha-1-phosphate uridylyltransferase
MNKAMILAAGRGERMRPLTDQTPKPLLSVGGQPLIVWHLKALAAAGFTEVTINTAHLADQLHQVLGDGQTWGLSIRFSDEPPGALETAGGIATARPWGQQTNEPFLVVNGDVFTDWDLGQARGLASAMNLHGQLGCLVLVPNPSHHPKGDFQQVGDLAAKTVSSEGPDAAASLQRLARVSGPTSGREGYTYSGIGLFHPALFAQTPPGQRAALAPLLFQAAEQQQLCGLVHRGQWTDVGTPARLADLDQALRSQRD